jgi:hypothetical protein
MNRQMLIIGLVAIILIGTGALLMKIFQPEPEPVAEKILPKLVEPEKPKPNLPPEPKPVAPRRRPEPLPEPEPVVEEEVSLLATLHIDSDVPGTQVFIDRAYFGATPVTAENLDLGTHQINVSVEGYDGLARTLDAVSGEQEIKFLFREVKLNASVDVIHKHRFGSCTGRLIATPQVLRYDTMHEDDIFSAGLLNLEIFEVDYLDKNLKIRPNDSKQYNFTDPEGNADRLFVFHRDVERARERLKNGDLPAQD